MLVWSTFNCKHNEHYIKHMYHTGYNKFIDIPRGRTSAEVINGAILSGQRSELLEVVDLNQRT